MITERNMRVLEFPAIREMLAEGALSALGAEKCRGLMPRDTLAEAQEAQAETEEAVRVVQYIGGHPLREFPDARAALRTCGKGGTLSAGMLLQVAELLRAARTGREALEQREDTPRLRALAGELTEARSLERDITDAIISEDEIADRASAELANIRRHLRGAQERIKEKLNQMIRSPGLQKYLQEEIVTVRGGRYVVPVRAEYRSQVPGLVHDQSASGATLFIEPMAAVEMGNDIREWTLKEAREIERILAGLSAETAPYAEGLERTVEVLAELDFIFAKGLLSRRMRGEAPKLNAEGRVRIKRGRHPLLPEETAVPVDLWLGEEFTVLVVTGPNTGGKTVTLKTLGLLSIMAQAGLQIPAETGTEMAVFEQIWADIGDEQSIEQSLSTFSGHMTNIVRIMREVTPRDLALFDELGAGTDPTEGAALAQSILGRLLRMGVRTAATTHYSELKVFALGTEGVENASVEFDVETLRPTYRLSIGVPGKSNAFEISRRLGLEDGVIEEAKKLLSGEALRFEDVMASAEYHRQIAERERRLAQEASRETVRMRDEAEKLRREMEERRSESLRKAREEARRIVMGARQESEAVLAELRRMKKEGAVKEDAGGLRRKLDRSLDELSEGLGQAAEPEATEPPETVRPGDTVRVLTLNREATVLAAPTARGEVRLAAGPMRFSARLKDLRLCAAPRKEKSTVRTHTGTLTGTVAMSCDVRGMSLEEALGAAERYLDEAVMAGLEEVTIVHGKGTGVLKTGLRQELRRNRHVKSLRPGMYGEGEDGVTVITLK